ncbi:MAG: hypothetical protein ACN6OP_17620, partial [Pseudomonadales bacterium]
VRDPGAALRPIATQGRSYTESYPRNLFAKVWIKCLCIATGLWIQAVRGVDQKVIITGARSTYVA